MIVILMSMLLLLIAFLIYSRHVRKNEIEDYEYVQLIYNKYDIVDSCMKKTVIATGKYRNMKQRKLTEEALKQERLHKSTNPTTKEILYNSYYSIERI